MLGHINHHATGSHDDDYTIIWLIRIGLYNTGTVFIQQ